VGGRLLQLSYNYNSASSNPMCQSNTQSHHGGAHTQCFSSHFSLAITTGQTAAKYPLALSFIRTTSRLSYWLVSASRSHHQSYNSASQLSHLQYAKSASFAFPKNVHDHYLFRFVVCAYSWCVDCVCWLYYSKFAKDQLFGIAYFNPIVNDTTVRGSHYCVLKLLICRVQLALVIFNSLKYFFIFITNTQKKHTVAKVILSKFWVVWHCKVVEDYPGTIPLEFGLITISGSR